MHDDNNKSPSKWAQPQGHDEIPEQSTVFGPWSEDEVLAITRT